jgi:nicotinate phosphoribosyltransferase
MMYGYYKNDMMKNIAVFDMFFRRNTDNNAYAIMAGLEQVIDFINNLHFSEEDIQYLRSLQLFDEDFLNYLKNFRFTGEVYAIPEGTVVFPYEPLVRVKAPIMQAQLIETALLNIVNHQTLIATKASRVVYAANGDSVLEFGLRRAQGPDAGIYGARAAIIGGCSSTSNVLTGQMFGVPAKGTHAHSWVMSFSNELESFRAYAKIFPETCLLLVDTYDTLKSGVPNAITVFKELRAKGYEPVGIRLDSGDLAYLSKKARQMLDEAGFEKTKIFASSDLDEDLIRDLKAQGAKIDVWGVGTKLITSENNPALGGVYKLTAEVVEGKTIPKIKKSDNIWKVTNPGYKKVTRIYDKATHKAVADLIMLDHEKITEHEPIELFDPMEPWKRMEVTGYYTKDLLKPVFIDGKQVYTSPQLLDIQQYCRDDLNTFWGEFKRLKNPEIYKIDLSKELYMLKMSLLNNINAL